MINESMRHIPVDRDTFRALLHQRGLTQSDVALRLGYSRNAVSNATGGQGWFSRTMAFAIENTFGIHPEDYAPTPKADDIPKIRRVAIGREKTTAVVSSNLVITGNEDDLLEEGVYRLRIERIDDRVHTTGICFSAEDGRLFWELYYRASKVYEKLNHVLRSALGRSGSQEHEWTPEDLEDAVGRVIVAYVYPAVSRADGQKHTRIAWTETSLDEDARESLGGLKTEVCEFLGATREQIDALMEALGD